MSNKVTPISPPNNTDRPKGTLKDLIKTFCIKNDGEKMPLLNRDTEDSYVVPPSKFEREVGVKTNFTLLKVNNAEESILCDFELFYHFNDLSGIENSIQNAKGFEEMSNPPDWTPHFFMYNQVSNDVLEGPTYTIGPDNRIFGYIN